MHHQMSGGDTKTTSKFWIVIGATEGVKPKIDMKGRVRTITQCEEADNQESGMNETKIDAYLQIVHSSF